jgi:hypothetical protein
MKVGAPASIPFLIATSANTLPPTPKPRARAMPALPQVSWTWPTATASPARPRAARAVFPPLRASSPPALWRSATRASRRRTQATPPAPSPPPLGRAVPAGSWPTRAAPLPCGAPGRGAQWRCTAACTAAWAPECMLPSPPWQWPFPSPSRTLPSSWTCRWGGACAWVGRCLRRGFKGM